ncbi:MAG TPA: SEC-C metal-binding domain-containing protein [Thermodesulfobacteriota bacterium]|nr:SEC-C metal-binding domain-containing protein [Thermodesulfobacteriota bacterium]
MSVNSAKKESSYFSSICVERCGGLCCEPWWGIIAYSVDKAGGLSNLEKFRSELMAGLRAREKRIVENYVTSEVPPRPLFAAPERYNVVLRDVKPQGSALRLELLAMFAFRCRFLSSEKTCAIHPALTSGRDIRPPHCGYMGSPGVGPGEKGYCRIIHAAVSPSGDDAAIRKAIEVERDAGQRHYKEGVRTVEEAADRVVEQFKEYCSKNELPQGPAQGAAKTGRNDPCPCGSGKKYKKCHGL